MSPHNQTLAVRLGFISLAPFVFLTFSCWVAPASLLGDIIRAQLYYGVAILSFLGGIQWGMIITHQTDETAEMRRALVWGVVPTLLAWLSMANPMVGLLVQVAGFILAYKNDKKRYQVYGVEDWFIRLRLRMTQVVITSQGLTFLAANVRAISE